MKKRLFIWVPIALFLFIIIILPPTGFYPPTKELYYNQYTKIYFTEGENFSACYTGRECYSIPEINGEWFQISIPPEADFPYLLGHRYTLKPDKDEWVILDTNRDISKLEEPDFFPLPPDDASQEEKGRVSLLNVGVYEEKIKRMKLREEHILFHGTKEEMLGQWKKSGWPDVTIVEYDELRKKFPQTMQSRFFQAIWIAGFIKLIVTIIGVRYWYILAPIAGLTICIFLVRHKYRKAKK
jgi:hypothetical protein